MKILRNEKGFALAFVLILAIIALGMTLAMLFMVSRGSYVSGQEKRYRTALEASRGGLDTMLQLVASRGNPLATGYSSFNLQLGSDLLTKLGNDRNSAAWSGLNDNITIIPNNAATYDMRIDLGAYRVYAKVVDTVVGNTGVDEGLLKSGGVTTSTGEVSAKPIPYLYTIEVLSESRVNPTERSKL